MGNQATATETAMKTDPAGSIHDEVIGHGNSPAAWTCVLIMILGSIVGGIGFAMASSPVFWAGVAIMLIGLIVGWIMKKVGYGVDGSKIQGSGH